MASLVMLLTRLLANLCLPVSSFGYPCSCLLVFFCLRTSAYLCRPQSACFCIPLILPLVLLPLVTPLCPPFCLPLCLVFLSTLAPWYVFAFCFFLHRRICRRARLFRE
jgi:hypothetical protein